MNYVNIEALPYFLNFQSQATWFIDILRRLEAHWIMKAMTILSVLFSVFSPLRKLLSNLLPLKQLQQICISFRPETVHKSLSIEQAMFGVFEIAKYVMSYHPEVILAIQGNAIDIAHDVNERTYVKSLGLKCVEIRRYCHGELGYAAAEKCYACQLGISNRRWPTMSKIWRKWSRSIPKLYWVKVEADKLGCKYYAIPMEKLVEQYSGKKILFIDDLYRGGKVIGRLLKDIEEHLAPSNTAYATLLAGEPIDGVIVREPDFTSLTTSNLEV